MANMRESIMGDIGNLSAPPGSRDWAVAVRLELQFTLNNVKGDAEHLDAMISLIREHQGYRQLTNLKGRTFLSYESFCVEPQPFGLGYRIEDINRIIGERRATAAKDLAAQAQPLKPVGAPQGSQNALKVVAEPVDDLPLMQTAAKNKVDAINFKTMGGASAKYLADRIARDRPDIRERMQAGEFGTVAEAARAAGIDTRGRRLWVARDPARGAKDFFERFGQEYGLAFAREFWRLLGCPALTGDSDEEIDPLRQG
jgi:hypothetical protein